tara:strand:+ start:148 stop:669 length:522 start_codon:yes stop_codon:yes gene_type:complete
MWSRRNILTGLAGYAALSGLGGCGFRPLYGKANGIDLSDTLASVEIGPIKDRVGQQIRNALLDGLSPRGAMAVQRYRLNVEASEGVASLAVQKSADATRADLSLSASYNLYDLETGLNLYNGTSRAISSFNILNSEFATLMAEKGARDRAVKQLSDDIRLKVAIFLKNYQGKG